jgi:hypothetical protein
MEAVTAVSVVLGVLGVLAALVVAWIVARAVRREARSARRTRHDEQLLDPRDVADLDAALAATEREIFRDRAARLSAGLSHLVERRVPVRTIEPDWATHAVRVRFADGTTMLVSGASPGAFGVLASRLREGSVCLLSCEPAPSGTNLVFDGPHGRETLHVTSAGVERPG